MAKADNPITVSGHFGIDPRKLVKLGVLDATLAIDTKLFIDPLLLSKSAHKEISKDAVAQYKARFEEIINLLNASVEEGDPTWKAAYKLFDFPEVAGTCLGYGAATIRGSGWGPDLRKKTLRTASKVVRIGVREPDLFPALALFEEKIGPDRLGDMTANIAIVALEKFNARVLKGLNLQGEVFRVSGKDCVFLRHPLEMTRKTPLILVPTDVLRDLPVALDWNGVQDAARATRELRENVSKHVSEIWKSKTKRDKAGLKRQALESDQAFMTMLSAMRAAGAAPYDVSNDPDNLVRWANLGRAYAESNPIRERPERPRNVDEVRGVVREIVSQYRHLIEHCGLNKELYNGKEPRHESSAQRLFFSAAYSYCKSLDIDISPEIDTGNGKLDFKFSRGFEARVLVELKLSTNTSTVSGYTKQLDVYREAQETTRAIYLVIDVGKMGDKDRQLMAIKNRRAKRKEPVSDLEFVDGTLKPTASKRK